LHSIDLLTNPKPYFPSYRLVSVRQTDMARSGIYILYRVGNAFFYRARIPYYLLF